MSDERDVSGAVAQQGDETRPDKRLMPLVGPAAAIWSAFLEGFLGFIKMLIQRVPTKTPTKLPRGRRSVRRRAVANRALVVHRVRSNYEGSSIAISRECVFEVGPARAGRLSLPRRALAGRQKIGWRWDERSESLLCYVDLEARR